MPTQSPTPPENVGPIAQSQQRPTGEQVSRGSKRGDVFLRLKNGELANVRFALAERECLDYLMRVQPQHFNVLLRLCRDDSRDPEMSEADWQKSIEFLKNETRDLRDDDTVRPLARNVLLSSYQVTTDGPVLTQPFELAGQDEKQVADMVDRRVDEDLPKFMRDFLRGDDSDRSR